MSERWKYRSDPDVMATRAACLRAIAEHGPLNRRQVQGFVCGDRTGSNRIGPALWWLRDKGHIASAYDPETTRGWRQWKATERGLAALAHRDISEAGA